MNVLIAGTGIISAIGMNVQENLVSLLHKKTGITAADILQTSHQFPVGEIKHTNSELASLAGNKDWEKLPRTALLSIIAAQEAWLPLAPNSSGLRIGFVSANTVGGMDLTETFYTDFIQNSKDTDYTKAENHECAKVTEHTLTALGLDCYNTTISTACSSSANAIMLAARLIKADMYDVIIAGGADSMSLFTINGFNALMILDKEYCRPFDENRKGLNLGEGAAYLVLCNEKAAKQLKANPIAKISGYANANDAFHQTASSPDGKGNQKAMNNALAIAGLSTDDIDYINLHGTGTENNDSSEGIAIQHLFGENVPPASSTKAFTGHTLGAAGAVEAVFSYLSIKEQITLPHLRLETPMSNINWQPTTELLQQEIKHVLSNSFGFGGNCSSLVISKV